MCAEEWGRKQMQIWDLGDRGFLYHIIPPTSIFFFWRSWGNDRGGVSVPIENFPLLPAKNKTDSNARRGVFSYPSHDTCMYV